MKKCEKKLSVKFTKLVLIIAVLASILMLWCIQIIPVKWKLAATAALAVLALVSVLLTRQTLKSGKQFMKVVNIVLAVILLSVSCLLPYYQSRVTRAIRIGNEAMDPRAKIHLYMMRDVLKELDREWVCVVNMDNHLKPVNFNIVSIGSINQSLAPIQNILKSGILSNCNNIMLMHNHPSGDNEPSREDLQLTKRLVEAAKLMDMNVVDHVVIGGQNGNVYSMREHDPDMFTSKDIDLDYINRMMTKEPSGNYAAGERMERAEEGRGQYSAGRNYDPKAAAEARRNEMKEITRKLEEGVAEIFSSEKYQKFLDTMAKFPQYSINNSLLIMMQKPDASLVQSYTGWKKMGRFVKRGEKGIRILAPTPFTIDRDQERMDADGKPVLDQDGEPVRETVQIRMMAFKPVSTFDISQTEGEPVQSLGVDELKGSVDQYAAFFSAMKEASPVPVGFEKIKGGAKGYFHTTENRIAIKEGMDEIQNVKTLVHEMAHAKLHNMTAQKKREDGGQTKSSKEVEAESVAYTV